MVDLAGKKCVACEGGLVPLTLQQAETMVQNIPGWELKDNAKKIYREYRFSNFKKSLAFVNRIGEIAEQEKHHPDIMVGWGYVNITIQTHAIQGLHENDFILAAKINKLGE